MNTYVGGEGRGQSAYAGTQATITWMVDTCCSVITLPLQDRPNAESCMTLKDPGMEGMQRAPVCLSAGG